MKQNFSFNNFIVFLQFAFLINIIFSCSSSLFAQDNNIRTSNNCRTITGDWTIEGYTRHITSKEIGINKKLSQINICLENIDYEDNPRSNCKVKKLLLRKSDLELKKRIIAKQGKLLEVELLTISIVLCEKYIKTDETELSYWGIKEIYLPKDRNSDEDGKLCISTSYNLVQKPFEEAAIISYNFKRNAIIGEDVKVAEKAFVFDWKLNVSNNKENTSDVVFVILPKADINPFRGINTDEDKIGIYYESDLEKLNLKIQEQISQQIK